MFRADEGRDDRPPPRYRIPLPTLDVDGTTVHFVNFQMTLHGINVSLVVHPGWEIRHPLEEDGTAARLWPFRADDIDLASLPLLPSNTVSWGSCRVKLKQGALGAPGLPPLQHSAHPFLLLPGVIPFIHEWGF